MKGRAAPRRVWSNQIRSGRTVATLFPDRGGSGIRPSPAWRGEWGSSAWRTEPGACAAGSAGAAGVRSGATQDACLPANADRQRPVVRGFVLATNRATRGCAPCGGVLLHMNRFADSMSTKEDVFYNRIRNTIRRNWPVHSQRLVLTTSVERRPREPIQKKGPINQLPHRSHTHPTVGPTRIRCSSSSGPSCPHRCGSGSTNDSGSLRGSRPIRSYSGACSWRHLPPANCGNTPRNSRHPGMIHFERHSRYR